MIRALLILLLWAGAAPGLSPGDLEARGFVVLDCTFTERCLIGAPCERAYRDMRWYLDDEAGIAYRAEASGALRRGLLMRDARWKARSEARAIVMPLREAVASQMTVFDGGGAIYSFQYAADPGSGQFLRGRCERSGGVLPARCSLVPRGTGAGDAAPLALGWAGRRMTVDGRPVSTTRGAGPLQVDRLRLGETDYAARRQGPVLFFSGSALMGRISPGAGDGAVLATVIGPDEVRRVYDGICEGLF